MGKFFCFGPSAYLRYCLFANSTLRCLLKNIRLHYWLHKPDLHDSPHISLSLSIVECIHPDNHLGTEKRRVTMLPFLLIVEFISSSYAQHNLKCLLRASFEGGLFSQLPGSYYVWAHFFPLHGKWLWGPEGPDISGPWPSSSCLYLTIYCDAPVMRMGIGPLKKPVGNWYSHLHLPLSYCTDSILTTSIRPV